MEQSAGVATEPSVATDAPGTTTSTISSFFKAELRAIKEKQGLQDQKQDKVLTQLQSM